MSNEDVVEAFHGGFAFLKSYLVFCISYLFQHFSLQCSLFIILIIFAPNLQGMSNWILIFIVQLNRTGLFA